MLNYVQDVTKVSPFSRSFANSLRWTHMAQDRRSFFAVSE